MKLIIVIIFKKFQIILYEIINKTTQFHSLIIHTQCRKYVVHDTLMHRQSLKNCYKLMNYDHRTHRLSLTQVAPGHVSEILAIDTERIKSENPELKKDISISNELIFFNSRFVYFILNQFNKFTL